MFKNFWLLHNLKSEKWNNKRKLQVDLSKTNLRGFDLSSKDLTGINFCESNFTGVNGNFARFDKAILAKITATDASFECAQFGSAVLFKATILANFNGANLAGADLSNAIFTGSSFSNANLQGTNLNEALLFGVTGNEAQIQDIALGNMHVTWTTKKVFLLERGGEKGISMNCTPKSRHESVYFLLSARM